jgi:Tfp pilus assembly protein PilN
MMRPANLLPSDLARGGGRQLPVPVIAAAGAGVAVIGALALGYTSAHSQASQRQSELDRINAEIAAVPRPKTVHSTINPALGTEKDARQTALDSALTGRMAWYTVLREMSLVLPGDVWLQGMTATSAPTGAAADPTGAATTPGLTITGYTYSQEAVARLLSRLALVPQLSNIVLGSSTKTVVSGQTVYNWSITAAVNDTSDGGGS